MKPNVIKKIEEYAVKYPNRVAYNINGDLLTYSELEKRSNKLANAIQEEMKEDKTPIIVYGHKNKYMLISFLAVVKSGRAYCPIDISIPNERIKNIISTVNPKIVLCTEELEILNINKWNINDIKCKCETNKNIEKKYYIHSNDVFYIIFTSGSTGIPKGVQITTDCLNSFLNWSVTLDNIGQKGKLNFINQAPFSFDLSVMDIYTSLIAGGTIIAIDKEKQKNISQMFELLEYSKANVWVSTPSFVEMCLCDKKFNSTLLPELQTFLFCGETLPNKTVSKLMERFKNSNIINTYGPTESTVAITSVLITPELNIKFIPLPVGEVKNNTYIFIQNEKHENLKEGDKGEIVIVGDSVSVGYYNNKKANKTFFSTYSIENKKYRLYRTGDMGYIKDKQLYYCGRADFQVKLHGYRIEIEDIESNILKNIDVNNVAVIPKYEEDGVTVKYLQSYLVPNFEIKNNLEMVIKIKEKMKEHLPNYMIPKKITFISNMPMTDNCKVDRKALREL